MKRLNPSGPGRGGRFGGRLMAWLVLAGLSGFAMVESWAGSAAGAAASPMLGAAQGHFPLSVHEEVTWLRQIGFSYLLAYMFFLSICLGSLFLVLVHHLVDAGWSAPIRRFLEQIASLFWPWMAILFIPIALLAPHIFGWFRIDPAVDHALHAKYTYLNQPFFYIRAVIYFAIWGWLTSRLRYWSLRQDETGSPECTYKMRRYAAGGIFLFALTLSGAAIDWIKALQHEWFSTMFGVFYFAGSIWVTLGTAYFITFFLQRKGPLREVVHKRQFHDLGALLFAFTVFHAYITFSQYFIIYNANIPEEAFWYVLRERGTWWTVGLVLIFGHFAVPFLALLRIDAKLTWWWMLPLCGWIWFMHYIDLSFNIVPVLHPEGFYVSPFDFLFLAVIGAVLFFGFQRRFLAAAPYPIKDPRLKEAVTQHVIPAPSPISVATDDIK